MAGLNSIRPIYARGGGGFTIKQTLSYMIIPHILIIHVQIPRRRAFVPEIVSLRKHNVFYATYKTGPFIHCSSILKSKPRHVRNTL